MVFTSHKITISPNQTQTQLQSRTTTTMEFYAAAIPDLKVRNHFRDAWNVLMALQELKESEERLLKLSITDVQDSHRKTMYEIWFDFKYEGVPHFEVNENILHRFTEEQRAELTSMVLIIDRLESDVKTLYDQLIPKVNECVSAESRGEETWSLDGCLCG